MTERCECCDLPLVSCGKAAQRKQLDELAEWRRGLLRQGWFPANYPGVCVKCGTGFGPGVLITLELPPPGWVAECCAKDTL